MRLPRLASYHFGKRVIDVLASGFGLVILSPVFVAVAVSVALILGRPVLFAQVRPGMNARTFTLYKFRTMRNIDPSHGWVTNEQRITRFGHFLRSTSLDELPSLWNILRGEMSLVGPRPLRVSYLPRYSSEQQRRHEVRPGLTGLAQVRGRNAMGWDETLKLDVEYVDRQSVKLDMSILIETVRTVVRRDGITEQGQSTRSEFLGPRSTRRVELVQLSIEHLATRVQWLNDPVVRAGASVSFIADLAAMETWFDSVREDPARYDWVGIHRQDRSLVSMCGLQRVEAGHFTLYIYVDPSRHGQGIGRDTMQLMIARARELGAKRLTLETRVDNAAAIRLYCSLGFEDFGAVAGGSKRRMKLDIESGHGNA
ncbi:GNAT family N-acetyltransferase [Paramicrobacterium agarici]|uniref:Lipopolysaccharide/colanic/teichoic acid biosynthesis glycosyltransferase n=1 Tax=Paramicrobacterium agarici TaxID=630514 RepID=A0A2A9DXM0_9MICO|nr:GNAT family N-acetyltransferase [Microbacterium agarici]PFG30669.1 lipopolysaccharide/colanic/teichoic acid biosynthesis glycosyltransferase [Microbacterium agarici]